MAHSFHRLPTVNRTPPTGRACENSTRHWPHGECSGESHASVESGTYGSAPDETTNGASVGNSPKKSSPKMGDDLGQPPPYLAESSVYSQYLVSSSQQVSSQSHTSLD